MKSGVTAVELDDVDRAILAVLQADCKVPLAQIGERVGLSATAVMDRVRKLESAGVVLGYHAQVDGRKLGLDVTSFIGVSISHPKFIPAFERECGRMEAVLECHHVTGAWSLLIKVKTWNTATLETLIARLRSIAGVTRTETMVVFSTHTERAQIPLGIDPPSGHARSTRRARSAK